MKQTLRRLITGTRALESRLTTAFEQGARTVAGSHEPAPPLEVINQAVDEVARHVQPAGRGRYAFPFNRVTITFVAPTPEDQARYEAICEGPPSIEERVVRRLTSAGCDRPEVDVLVEFAAALPDGDRRFDLALARVDPSARSERGQQLLVSLTVTNGTASQSEYAFMAFPVAIGRGADVRDSRNQLLRVNHVAFVEGEDDVNRSVSRRHARIELDGATGKPRIVDDNSAQGTSIIRGTRGIAVPRGSRGLGIQSGDEIVIGQARIRIDITIAPPAPANANTTSRSRQ